MPAEQSNGSAIAPVGGTEEDVHERVLRLEDEVRHLTEAVSARTLMGTAIGILAERYGCTSHQAWTLITRVSSHTNLKAREIARVVVAVVDGSDDPDVEALVAIVGEHLPGLVRRTGPAVPGAVPGGASTRAGGGAAGSLGGAKLDDGSLSGGCLDDGILGGGDQTGGEP
jgi:hypothetical protein